MSAQVPKTTVCLWYDHNAEDAATEAMAKGGEADRRAFAAMMTMKKIDAAAIEAAVHADA
jgi:predicted 3-demethylubiquinone-9 3-methyltransferase (glyoxalase superfamily)